MGTQRTGGLRAGPRRVLAALQRVPAGEWIDLVSLLEAAGLQLPDDEHDTQLQAINVALDEIEGAGYAVRHAREHGTNYYQLDQPAAGGATPSQ